MDFSETIAAFGLIVGRRRLIVLMKLSEHSKSRSYLDYGTQSFTWEN